MRVPRVPRPLLVHTQVGRYHREGEAVERDRTDDHRSRLDGMILEFKSDTENLSFI